MTNINMSPEISDKGLCGNGLFESINVFPSWTFSPSEGRQRSLAEIVHHCDIATPKAEIKSLGDDLEVPLGRRAGTNGTILEALRITRSCEIALVRLVQSYIDHEFDFNDLIGATARAAWIAAVPLRRIMGIGDHSWHFNISIRVTGLQGWCLKDFPKYRSKIKEHSSERTTLQRLTPPERRWCEESTTVARFSLLEDISWLRAVALARLRMLALEFRNDEGRPYEISVPDFEPLYAGGAHMA